MKKIARIGAALVMATLFGTMAQAADIAGIKASLTTQRENMVAMIGSTDAAVQKEKLAAVTAATKALEDGLAAALADAGTTPDQAAKLKAFKEIWDAFKSTRDTQVIPLITAGKNADAKAIATSVQAERMQKLVALLGDLGAK